MNRRDFLRVLGVASTAVAATSVFDPEALLWVPGRKTIIDLGAGRHELVSPDDETTFITADWVTKEALMVMKNQLRLAESFDREIRKAFLGDLEFYRGEQWDRSVVKMRLPEVFQPVKVTAR